MPRIVITGVGVISPNGGIGKDSFSNAIFGGISGIKQISLFDTSDFKTKTAAQIDNFMPENIIGKDGLRVLDRSTKLLCSSAKMALDDAGFAVTEGNCRDVGLAVGNTFGSLQSISDFDKVAIKEGPKYINPSLFPNTVINAGASQTAIRLNIKGFNVTISTGFSASLDAVIYAADSIKLGRKNMVLAGGVEELSVQEFIGFYRAGCLAGLEDGSSELSCPFDRRRNGIILGEGSAIFVLEKLESALGRGAHIYAEIKSYGSYFGAKDAMSQAMAKVSLGTEKIDYICCAANSTKELDRQETSAIKEALAAKADSAKIGSIKSMIGECFSASGALQLAAGVCAIEKQMAAPNLNYEEPDPDCGLSYTPGKAVSSEIENVLINAFSIGGSNSSLMISKFAG